MTTARADLITLDSAVDKDGDTMPAVKAFGTGFTLANVAASAQLVGPDPNLTRRFLVHAEGARSGWPSARRRTRAPSRAASSPPASPC